MIIEINTDKTISGHKEQQEYFTSLISDAMQRHSSHITRIEAHLKDENGSKEGGNDKKCTLEARIEGRQPIAVSNQADTVEKSLNGAIEKLEASVQKIIGKIKSH